MFRIILSISTWVTWVIYSFHEETDPYGGMVFFAICMTLYLMVSVFHLIEKIVRIKNGGRYGREDDLIFLANQSFILCPLYLAIQEGADFNWIITVGLIYFSPFIIISILYFVLGRFINWNASNT